MTILLGATKTVLGMLVMMTMIKFMTVVMTLTTKMIMQLLVMMLLPFCWLQEAAVSDKSELYAAWWA